MTVYTNGERGYALAMARTLDPTGKLFNGRVISHGDSTRKGTKDLDVLLGAESAVLILDDTVQVWPRHRDNLLVVERYHFFTASRLQFGRKSPSFLELNLDESPAEGSLSCILAALNSIHDQFFAEFDAAVMRGEHHSPPDVREVLHNVRCRILENCHLVFSRIFPVATQNPTTHPLWIMACDLGASCSLQLDPTVTHVVALDVGTDKAKWAISNNVHLVHPKWLESCFFLWKRVDEKKFPVKPLDADK